MTFSVELITAWATKVFADPRIKAFDAKIYPYDIVAQVNESHNDASHLYSCGFINAVYFQIQRFTQKEIGNCSAYRYRIIINYIRKAKKAEDEHAVQRFFEVLDEVYTEQMQPEWDAGVIATADSGDYPQLQTGNFAKDEITHLGQFIYFARKN